SFVRAQVGVDQVKEIVNTANSLIDTQEYRTLILKTKDGHPVYSIGYHSKKNPNDACGQRRVYHFISAEHLNEHKKTLMGYTELEEYSESHVKKIVSGDTWLKIDSEKQKMQTLAKHYDMFEVSTTGGNTIFVMTNKAKDKDDPGVWFFASDPFRDKKINILIS